MTTTTTTSAKCQGTATYQGSVSRPCKRSAAPGTSYCWAHDPRNAERRRTMHATGYNPPMTLIQLRERTVRQIAQLQAELADIDRVLRLQAEHPEFKDRVL